MAGTQGGRRRAHAARKTVAAGQSRRGSSGPVGDGRVPRGHGPRPAHGRRHDASHGAGQAYIEGRRTCAEALDAGVPVRRALVMHGGTGGRADATMERLATRLDEAGIEVELVSRARLDALSPRGAHQGIMLEVAPFPYAALDDVVAAANGRKDALVIVLDHVIDEGNLGAIVRSAEVVGASGVVIAKARAAGVGVGAYKTSAGAVVHMPIARVPNVAAAVGRLRDAGFWAVAASEHAELTVWDVPISGRIALVAGSEGRGVSRLVRERCDIACRLPQRGHIESLNVAQATTVLCYEWLRNVSVEPEGPSHGSR